MTLYETYLANTQTQRDAAAKPSLPNRQDMRERSPERWEDMARGARDTATRAAFNLAAKSAATD